MKKSILSYVTHVSPLVGLTPLNFATDDCWVL